MQFQQIPNTKNEKNDFIKRFHVTKIESLASNLTIIYENQFKIRLLQLQSNTQNLKQDEMDIQRPESTYVYIKDQQSYRDIHFQTVPYDAVLLNNKRYSQNQDQLNLIASSRSMPVRVYEIHKENFTNEDKKPLNYCTFKDNKPNSQSFLSPYQFAIKNDKVIGVGKKFCSLYDCQKIKTTRIKAFDKIHLSTVQILSDQTTALIGDFIGKIYFIDLREENQKLNDNHFKPHVDAVFHVKSFQSNENLFLSSARKDNFTYLFDRRNLSTFVSFIEFERNSNQRYGLSINDDKLSIGTQDGSIYINQLSQLQNNQLKSIDEEQNLFSDRSGINVADLSITGVNNNKNEIFYSLGTRFYQEQSQMQDIPKVNNFGLRKFLHSKQK